MRRDYRIIPDSIHAVVAHTKIHVSGRYGACSYSPNSALLYNSCRHGTAMSFINFYVDFENTFIYSAACHRSERRWPPGMPPSIETANPCNIHQLLSRSKSYHTCMRHILITMVLLCCSNVFMTFAWYGHLKTLSHKPLLFAVLVSWLIALFEYVIQVPANRIGHQVMNLGQLKILQEVITLTIILPFSIFYMKEHLRLDYLWACLCILGAVFFIFRERLVG